MVFNAGRLKRRDDVNAGEYDTCHLALILLHLHDGARDGIRRELDDREVNDDGADTDKRQQRAVRQQQYEVERGNDKVQYRLSKIARDEFRYAVVVGYAGSNITGVPLVKERHRQAEHVRKESVRRYQRQLVLELYQYCVPVESDTGLEKR